MTNREIDITLTEKLFGWKFQELDGYYYYHVTPDCTCGVDYYSTDPAAMLLVIEKMREKGWVFHYYCGTAWAAGFGRPQQSLRHGVSEIETLPLAVAIAALAALETK